MAALIRTRHIVAQGKALIRAEEILERLLALNLERAGVVSVA